MLSFLHSPTLTFIHDHRKNHWNAEVGSQETPGVTGKFGLGVQNKAGQRLTDFLTVMVIRGVYLIAQQAK